MLLESPQNSHFQEFKARNSSLNDLESIGIKRVSFGPGASYAAMGLLKKISNDILNERNTDSLLNGGISYEELISLTEPRPE